MREHIERRIESLRAEYRAGQEMLVEMEGRQASMKFTLTRIGGAIQVLEELLQRNSLDAETTMPAGNAETRVAV